jgi:DNA-binding transcriptional LysR family regulator
MREGHNERVSLTPWIAFVAACDRGTLGAVAQELGYTQSAVSRQIAALELDLGVPLLERHPRGVRATAAGASVLVHARLLVAEAERAQRAARSPGAGRHLAVGAVPSMAIALVPTALQASEGVASWSLLTDLTPALVERVAAHELDLAVVTDAPPGLPTTSAPELTHLLDDPMAVLVPVGHEASVLVRLEDLAGEVWLEDNLGSRALLQRAAARHGLTLDIELVGGDLMTKVALVAAGHGVAFVPSSLGPALRPDVRLAMLDGAPVRGIYAATRAGDEATNGLVQSLRAAARSLGTSASRGQ